MRNKKIIIGSRGSKLALIYANRAKELVAKNEKTENVEIKSITTKGDTIKDVRVSEHGGKGLFCKTIEQELLEKKIDVAVHALKDMPAEETEGLLTNCFLERKITKLMVLLLEENQDLIQSQKITISSQDTLGYATF